MAETYSPYRIPEKIGKTRMIRERNNVFILFVAFLVAVALSSTISDLNTQKSDLYKGQQQEALYGPYKNLVDGSLAVDKIIETKVIAERAILKKNDPWNYKYVEFFISEKLREHGVAINTPRGSVQNFLFGEGQVFLNSTVNTVNIKGVTPSRENLGKFIEDISRSGYLSDNLTIEKNGGLWSFSIDLRFSVI